MFRRMSVAGGIVLALAVSPTLAGNASANDLAVTNGLAEEVDIAVATPEGAPCGHVVLAPKAGEIFPTSDVAGREASLCRGATFLMLKYRIKGAGDETECPSQVRNGTSVTISGADGYPFCAP